MHRARRHEPTPTAGRRQCDLAAEFIALVRLAFGDAFGVRRVHAVNFSAVRALLFKDFLSRCQQRLQLRIGRARLARDVAQRAPQQCSQLFGATRGALHLARVRVAIDLQQQPLAHAPVALAQRDPTPPRRLDQPCARAIIQPRIGWKTHVRLLHRRIDVDPLKLRRRDRPQHQSRRERLAQQRLGPALAHALAPARQAAGLQRPAMLEKLHPAQILPVRILDPAGHHVRIAQVVGVLQIMQRDQQPRGMRGAAIVFAKQRAQALLQARPRHRVGQFHQPVSGVHERA